MSVRVVSALQIIYGLLRSKKVEHTREGATKRTSVCGTQKSTVFCAIHVKNEIYPIRKVRHVSSKESNVTGVIFDSFSCHMAGDLIIFP